MIKCLQLCNKLFLTISRQEWDIANELVDELQVVLRTYRQEC